MGERGRGGDGEHLFHTIAECSTSRWNQGGKIR